MNFEAQIQKADTIAALIKVLEGQDKILAKNGTNVKGQMITALKEAEKSKDFNFSGKDAQNFTSQYGIRAKAEELYRKEQERHQSPKLR